MLDKMNQVLKIQNRILQILHLISWISYKNSKGKIL